MVGLLEYLQLLSGPDQVHRPYNTSYLTNFMTLPHGVATRPTGTGDPLPLVSVSYGSCKPLLDYIPIAHPSMNKLFAGKSVV